MNKQKTPKHDAMCLWLMEPNNLSDLLPIDYEKEFRYVSVTSHNGIDCMGMHVKNFKGEFKGKTTILLESPLKSNSNYIGGYIDILVNCFYENFEYETSRPLFVSKIIEVKPKIDSFGEVVRQINKYRKLAEMKGYNGGGYLNKQVSTHSSEYYLFTFDKRFDGQFESQGITVLHPPKEVSIENMIEEFDL